MSSIKFKPLLLLVAVTAIAWPTALAAPIGPHGPCPDAKVDAILNGQLDPSACCSYGQCKGDVVVSVGQ